jgi:tripartite-type tricarboxylate transporter receptor subunit TctC
MNRREFIVGALAAATAPALRPTAARAQLGVEPIKIVFPFAAGGSGDALSRLMAEAIRAELDRPVIVENKTGAAGRIGVKAVKDAAPDGMTLLLTPIAPVAVYQHVYPQLGYDPVADFAPISQIATFDFGLAVNAETPVKSLKDLVAWVKQDVKRLSYGTPGAGTLPHFFAVLFGRAAGLDLQHVSYRGSAAALKDLLGGQLPMLMTTNTDLLEAHKAGRVRVLATSAAGRSPFLPDIPTFKEAGYAIEGTSWYGMFAPAHTPPDVIARLNAAVVKAVKSAPIQERLRAFGLQPTGTSAAEFAAIQKRDSAFWAPAVKASGFTPRQ